MQSFCIKHRRAHSFIIYSRSSLHAISRKNSVWNQIAADVSRTRDESNSKPDVDDADKRKKGDYSFFHSKHVILLHLLYEAEPLDWLKFEMSAKLNTSVSVRGKKTLLYIRKFGPFAGQRTIMTHNVLTL